MTDISREVELTNMTNLNRMAELMKCLAAAEQLLQQAATVIEYLAHGPRCLKSEGGSCDCGLAIMATNCRVALLSVREVPNGK